MATWTGSRKIPNGAWTRACCGLACARSSCSASITGRRKIRWLRLRKRTRGAISAYAQGDDYHDVIKKRLKTLARWLRGHNRRRSEGVRRHGRRDGKAAGAGRGPRLAGQAHQPRLARVRLLAVPRRDFYRIRPAARRGRRRSLRHLQRLPGDLPDRGVPRALQARCAALHLVSHHREQGTDPARIPQSDRQPHLWLRRLPRRLPLEQVRADRPRDKALRARRAARAVSSPNSHGSTTPLSARCLQNPRSSASAAIALSAMC